MELNDKDLDLFVSFISVRYDLLDHKQTISPLQAPISSSKNENNISYSFWKELARWCKWKCYVYI